MRKKYQCPLCEEIAVSREVQLLVGTIVRSTGHIRSQWTEADYNTDAVSLNQTASTGFVVDETHATTDGNDGFFGY
jgi:hypothetical protein